MKRRDAIAVTLLYGVSAWGALDHIRIYFANVRDAQPLWATFNVIGFLVLEGLAFWLGKSISFLLQSNDVREEPKKTLGDGDDPFDDSADSICDSCLSGGHQG
jgi:hypothetical protein